MGTDKALLDIGGVPLLERVLCAARPLGLPLFLVAEPRPGYTDFGIPVVPDSQADQGPLGGLDTALDYLQRQVPSADALLLLACDLPHLSCSFLRFLLERFAGSDALAPVDEHGPQPLCAVYGPGAAPAVKTALAQDRLSLRRLLTDIETAYLPRAVWSGFDPDGRLLVNLNTPEDYSRARRP